MRMRAFIAKYRYGARHAAQKRDAPVNENCHRRHRPGVAQCQPRPLPQLIGVAGAGGVIADGIGKAPAALLRIETPAGLKNRLDKLAPQIDCNPGAGNSGVGQGGEGEQRTLTTIRATTMMRRFPRLAEIPNDSMNDLYRNGRRSVRIGGAVQEPNWRPATGCRCCRLRQARRAAGRPGQARAWCLRL